MGLDMGAFDKAWRLLKASPRDQVRDYPQGDDRTMHPSVKQHADKSMYERLDGLGDEDYPKDRRAYNEERNKLVQPQTPPSPFPYYDEKDGGVSAKYKTVQGPDGNFYQVYDDEGTFIPPE